MATEEDLFQISDKDIIGTDDRNVGTDDDFQQYLR